MSDNFRMSEEEVAAFHENGYAGPFDLYEPEYAKKQWRKLRAAFLDDSHMAYPDCTIQYDRHFDVDFLSQHVCRPEIVERVAQVLGPDVMCWRTEVHPKTPGAEGTDWHQAASFADETRRNFLKWPENTCPNGLGGAITVWCAFTDVTREMAPLQFIPGTHTRMYYDETKIPERDPNSINQMVKSGVKRGFLGYDYTLSQIDPNWDPEKENHVTMEMQAGQFIIFWSTLVHASLPHTGKKPRYATNVRYVPPSVEVYPGDINSIRDFGAEFSIENWRGVLVAGRDETGVNKMATANRRGTPFAPPLRTRAA